jgi:uncharacterized protein YcbK (DUF882 family)
MHTREQATIVFKRDGRYDQAGLQELNRFLRDWRQNKPTKMDPKLFDLVWEVYRRSGATQPIHVICGYRAPETNAMLRRRSSGVAENSLHIRGQALDFFIPGVPLSKLRAVSLQVQAGGVGYYPTSGSPFVHLDTGSVRHWPRMNRSQLLAVFPQGKTLHVPSDGKPLPGYAEALASYKARQVTGVAFAPASGPTGGDRAAVAVAAADVPLPRIAPDRDGDRDLGGNGDQVAMAIAIAESDSAAFDGPLLSYPPAIDRVIGRNDFGGFDDSVDAEIDFDSVYAQPPVPADLANAMAARDKSVRPAASSLPISPTAVVSTVDIGVDLSRTLRADAITAAVFRDTNDPQQGDPPLLAYAAAGQSGAPEGHPGGAGLGVPVPQLNPLRDVVAVEPPVRERSADEVYSRLPDAPLTLTKLDTLSLRLWIGPQSTREKRYAVFTMPDFAQMPALLDKPEVTFAARFDRVIYRGMRTDHFAGSPTQPPAVVDLTTHEIFAAR